MHRKHYSQPKIMHRNPLVLPSETFFFLSFNYIAALESYDNLDLATFSISSLFSQTKKSSFLW